MLTPWKFFNLTPPQVAKIFRGSTPIGDTNQNPSPTSDYICTYFKSIDIVVLPVCLSGKLVPGFASNPPTSQI